MTVLGLDIATKTGYSFYSKDQVVSGFFKAKGNDEFEKAKALSTDLRRKIQAVQLFPNCCYIEKPLKRIPAKGNSNTLALLNMYCGALQSVVTEFGIPCKMIADSTWRKGIFGVGRNSKEQKINWKQEALDYCNNHLGISIKSHDEAEAILISKYGYDIEMLNQ